MNSRRQEGLFLWALIAMQVVVLILTYLVTNSRTEALSTHVDDVLMQQAMSTAEERLRERVETTVNRIEYQRKTAVNETTFIIQTTANQMRQLPEQEAVDYVTDLMSDFTSSVYGSAIQVVLLDTQTGTATLLSGEEVIDLPSRRTASAAGDFVFDAAYREEIRYPSTEVCLFATQSDLDQIVQDAMYDIIHASRFGKNGYVWVNEILDYNGGDGYAVRLINPRLKDSEGTLLSTETTDQNGSLPYKEELEGVRKEGKLFQTYTVPNAKDGRMMEKVSYSRLYVPYNWIIGSADPMNEVLSHVSQLDAYNRKVMQKSHRNILVTMLAVFALDIWLILLSNRQYSTSVRKRIHAQREENEKIFELVTRYSDRVLYKYEISTRKMIPWKNQGTKKTRLGQLSELEYSEEILDQADYLAPECVEPLKVFFRQIHKGAPDGEVELQMTQEDGQQRWYSLKASSLFDEEGNPTFAILSIENLTDRRTIRMRADYDAMTGFLRREIGEAQVRQMLAAGEEPGGILVMLDLDDLKGINDSMGHSWGDQAITGVADTLKGHFRKGDLLIRMGGDEFMIYLCGAGKSVGAVERSMGALLRKLAGTYVGDHNERAVHCSIGCAVEQAGEDFEALYRRADKALYHVKRSGKSNFAFYEPAMEEQGYEFHSKRLLTAPNSQWFAMEHLQNFLGTLASFYPMVLSVNLTENTYYLMEKRAEGVFSDLPAVGVAGEFLTMAGEAVHPDDREDYFAHLTRDALLQAHEAGKESVHHHFRFFNDGRYRWTECIVIFHRNEEGDLCDFMLLRWMDGAAEKLERLYLTPAESEAEQPSEVEDVLLECLDTLNNEPDLDEALDQLLQMVADYYQADRSYIMEIDPERNLFNNTFEWCMPGVMHTMDQMQKLPASVLDYWVQECQEEGGFFIPSVEELDHDSPDYNLLKGQDVESLMAASLVQSGRIVGFVGVDNPSARISDLTLLRGISGFILEALEKRSLMTELEQLSSIDALTGLQNRSRYMATLKRFEARPPRALGLIGVDVNGMKDVNDTYGFEHGDRVLKQAAELLRQHFSQYLYRIGGDEFAVLCVNVPRETFEKEVEELRAALDADPLCNMTVAFAWGEDTDSLNVNALRQQMQEMRRAEKQAYYHQALQDGQGVSGSGYAGEVLREVEEGRFTVFYQPQVDLRTGKVMGAEALVRKLDEDGTLIPPVKFIPAYELGGVIRYVDLFVLSSACATLQDLREQGYNLRISVNFSRITLLEPNIVEEIQNICDAYKVPTSCIIIEVTESIGKMDADQLHRLIERLKEAGFTISLDDFGSEYSNLAILASMDFDEIKFDRSLVNSLEENRKSRLVIESSLQLCRAMEGTSSLAEGIETRGQLELLESYQCDYGQGYYFSRPLPLEQFEQFLTERM